MRRSAAAGGLDGLTAESMRALKRAGFGDAELALAVKAPEAAVRERRIGQKLKPVYKRIDTCAAEFESFTPYLYSSYEPTCEANPNDRPKVIILGSGPNRIGQGIEFDYCCCHAAFALREEGLETVMINCNPETVSTDYDTADRLYFEPLTFEDVMAVIETERSAAATCRASCSSAARRRSSCRSRCSRRACASSARRPTRSTWPRIASGSRSCLTNSAIPQPASGTATSQAEAREVAASIGFPVVVRPSYVLGGRAMAIVYDVGDARSLHDARRRRVARAPDPRRQVPRRRVRVRRRRRGRRDGRRRDRRHHGAHRGGGHPLGRQLVRRAAVHLPRAPSRDDPRLHAADRPRAQGRRPDERAVRHQGRRRLRARGQPARVAHGAVPVEGHRRAAGQGGGAGDGRPDAGGARAHQGPRGGRRVRQEPGVPVRALSRASTRFSGPR